MGMTIQTVHTTGINWASVLTITCSVIVALSIILGFIVRAGAKYIANRITGSIDEFSIKVIQPMAIDIASLKAMQAADRRNRR